MTILSAQTIKVSDIISPFAERSEESKLTHGLSACGYDVRLVLRDEADSYNLSSGEFMLAATAELFHMPTNVAGIVHDKSSLARRGLSVFNTVIEPGWRGWLTLELVNHGPEPIMLHAGQAIAQVIFHLLDQPSVQPYDGKYQDQEYGPQGARK